MGFLSRSDQLDIAMFASLNPSGLSVVAQEYFKCLTTQGFRVIPIWQIPPEPQHVLSVDKTLAQNMIAASNFEIGAKPLQFHTGRADIVVRLKDESPMVASMVLEGNTLSRPQVIACRSVDAIMSPSRFCMSACLSSGVPKKKLTYAPYPLDALRWNEGVKPTSASNGTFKFLFMNSWYERKGWDVLLRAWWNEFSADDQVELTIKSYRENDRTEPLEARIAVYAAKIGVDRTRKAKIRIVDETISSESLPSFMKSFDAYVSPHRSEGFGMNIWHAMALGVPVICTDYGGNCDFTLPDTAWLIDNSGMVKPSVAEMRIFTHLGDIVWAEPDMMHFCRQMRECMLYADERKKRASLGAKLVKQNYSFDLAFNGFEKSVVSISQDVWDTLCTNRLSEYLVKQNSPRFVDYQTQIRMIEI